MVGNNSLGNRSTDSINLGCDTSSLNTNTDVKVGEFVLSKDEDGLEGLQAKGFGLDKLNGLTIDLDKTTSLLGESTGSGSLFPVMMREELMREIIVWFIRLLSYSCMTLDQYYYLKSQRC